MSIDKVVASVKMEGYQIDTKEGFFSIEKLMV